MNLKEGTWKEHETGLFVSRNGEVFVPKSGKVKEHYTYGCKSNGYLYVMYKRKNYFVHRLVAQCFIPNPQCKPEVDHINMVKTDNRACNLRWASYKEQMNFDDQDVQERRAEKRSKKVLQLTIEGEPIREWASTHECGRNGFSQSNVAKCCRGERSTAYGFKWQYA